MFLFIDHFKEICTTLKKRYILQSLCSKVCILRIYIVINSCFNSFCMYSRYRYVYDVSKQYIHICMSIVTLSQRHQCFLITAFFYRYHHIRFLLQARKGSPEFRYRTSFFKKMVSSLPRYRPFVFTQRLIPKPYVTYFIKATKFRCVDIGTSTPIYMRSTRLPRKHHLVVAYRLSPTPYVTFLPHR